MAWIAVIAHKHLRTSRNTDATITVPLRALTDWSRRVSAGIRPVPAWAGSFMPPQAALLCVALLHPREPPCSCSARIRVPLWAPGGLHNRRLWVLSGHCMQQLKEGTIMRQEVGQRLPARTGAVV